MADQKVIDYIKTEEAQGYTPEQLKKALLNQGYTSEAIDEAIKIVNAQPAQSAKNTEANPVQPATAPAGNSGRPTLITVIAVIFMIMGGLGLLNSIFSVMNGFSSYDTLSELPMVGSWISSLMIVFMVISFLFSAAQVTLGYGLWNLKNWARVGTNIYVIIQLVLLVPLALLLLITIIGTIFLAVPITINILILIYLRKEEVKKCFS